MILSPIVGDVCHYVFFLTPSSPLWKRGVREDLRRVVGRRTNVPQPRDGRDFPMLSYDHRLKFRARALRTNPTDAELHLWHRLRRKQILAVQFYRQKAIGIYIVDFYAPAAKLVIEVDGGHQVESRQVKSIRCAQSIWSGRD